MRLRAGQRVGVVFHADRTHLLCVRGVDRIYRASTPFMSDNDGHEYKPNRFVWEFVSLIQLLDTIVLPQPNATGTLSVVGSPDLNLICISHLLTDSNLEHVHQMVDPQILIQFRTVTVAQCPIPIHRE